MKKRMVSLLVLVLFLLGAYPVNAYADSAGSQGDLIFVEDDQKSSLTEDGFTQKPATSLPLPNTGEKGHFLWIISGAIIGFCSLYLMIIKQQSRRE